MAVKGADEIVRNFRKAVRGIEGDIAKGLRLGLTEIKGEAQEITPVEFGVLINSAFVQVERIRGRVLGRVGFTPLYAPFVHEMPPENNFTKPGTGPKFLEKPVLRAIGTGRLLDLIKRFAKR